MWTCPQCASRNFNDAKECHKCKTPIAPELASAVAAQIAQELRGPGLIRHAFFAISSSAELSEFQKISTATSCPTIVPKWESRSDASTLSYFKWTTAPIESVDMKAWAKDTVGDEAMRDARNVLYTYHRKGTGCTVCCLCICDTTTAPAKREVVSQPIDRKTAILDNLASLHTGLLANPRIAMILLLLLFLIFTAVFK